MMMPASNASTIVKVLGDTTIKEDLRLKAAQELAETFESNVSSAGYPAFLEMTMKTFLKVLQEGECHFFSDFNIQQMRKLILEMIHRLPVSETVRPYVKSILTLMLKLLKTDNEDNVLVCLRIIIDLHKQYRPTFQPEIQHFIAYVRNIYSDLPKNLNKIFEPREQIRVKDLKDVNLETLLAEIYSSTTIYVEKQEVEGKVGANTFTLLPRGVNSLKVLQELPIILVLMYQIYKQHVHQEIVEFVPLIMTTISLQPSPVHRAMPNFNREIFVDFMSAQIKALSFLAYIVRTFLSQFQEVINNHSTQMVEGMISLLRLCPMEVASTRKELLVATRHILATDLRNKFISSIDLLFDEDLLLGRGYYSNESLKPLAYSTLADLIHHVRQHLKLDILTKAVYLFSRNVHDESLPTSIQTMSCKLLLNLVDCIRIQRNDDSFPSPTPRELLMTMLKVFTLKFHTIAKLQLPLIMQKWKSLSSQTSPTIVDINKEMINIDVNPESLTKLTSIGFSSANTLNVCEYKSLVKTLICGVKTITYGINLTDNAQQKMPVTFQPEEVLIFIDLFNWALEVLDIYMINIPLPGMPMQQKTINQLPRSKDEKELLEHFSGLFLTMSPQNFQEIFSSTIDFMVDRISQNIALQVIANSFLASPNTSPLFATVLIEYLLERMDEMGSNIERSNLYLRLFKLVFGSVSLFANQNEQMLRPHLHNIVNRSMELAMTAKEPYNYFLLLRALFRSIGGGSHDKLYKEFLPLLPNLLEGLNRLQSGFHKQHMKDLFVELCLTVPVRLSSLLPYLPMLMDPLVSALNGSPTLVNQGLRTLELCVDNLQPDFLYDHIQPVRAELMQALWKTLRNTDSAALVAFRVLGKFGGGNRKMMIEPQKLEYNSSSSKEINNTAIVAYFQEQRKPIDFPVDKVIETAFNALKTSSTDPYYWAQSWEVIRCFLAASICLTDEKHILQKLFTHPSFTEGNVPNINITSSHFHDSPSRKTHQIALTAMFVAAATKELRQSVLPVFVDVVRHYTMVAIAQQAGPFPLKHNQQFNNIDPLVLIDALAAIMGHEEKELCKAANFAMILIIRTATTIMGSKERACRLAVMQYLAEKMSNLCYERPWYAKLGGVIALKFLCEHMSMRWLYQHLYTFLKAYLFVIMDLTGEVSSGAISLAREYLANMLNICMVPLADNSNDELISLQRKAMFDVTHELVRRITSPHSLVRETAMDSLKQIASLQKVSVTEVMMPHKESLEDIVPPKKHLLKHQPAAAQIGLMDAFSFTSTEPKLFTLDINIVTHKLFFHEVITLAEVDDVYLSKLDCFKNITNLIPLRKSALKALASCHYLGQDRKNVKEKIFTILYKALEKNSELQETAFECMQKFNLGSSAEKEFLLHNLRPLLLALGDHRNLTINIVKRLSYLTQLFPAMFNEKLCDQLLEIIKKMLQASVTANKNQNFLKVSKTGETEVKIATIIEIFHQIPAASAKFAPSLISLVLAAEKELMIEPSSPYRAPLVKFLKRYPEETVEIFLNEINIKNPQYNRFLIYLLKQKEGCVFQVILEKKEYRLVELILKEKPSTVSVLPEYTAEDETEAQHQSILIIHNLIEMNDKWIDSQVNIINALTLIWTRELGSSGTNEIITCDLWHLVGKILLRYFEGNPSNIKLLYELLKAFCMRFIPDFQFLRDFIQNTVCQTYTVQWMRDAFFLYVEFHKNPMVSVELNVKILTMIIIPGFAICFDKGHGEELIGASTATSSQAQDEDDNIVSVFINKVIDPEKSIEDDDDALRIALLQLACLLVERSSAHIHDGSGSTNKKEGSKLRRLMTFAWPCLLAKNYVDPSARYHGHLLLAHIISKLAINKRIVLQVFHSLLKAHAVDARSLVRQALEIITPALPFRMDDGNQMLTHWTRKIILEEGHSMQQLNHILQLIVRHYKVYFPVRHQLVQQMISSMNRLGFSPNSSVDYRKLAVELAEVVIKWELQRIREETDGPSDEDPLLVTEKTGANGSVKRSLQEDEARKKTGSETPGTSTQSTVPPQRNEDYFRPIDRNHCDAVLNFLFKLACQLGDIQTQIPGIQSPSEGLSRRCVTLIKRVLDPNCWLHSCDLKLTWLDKIFGSISTEPTAANIGNICTGLELLAYLLGCMRRDQLLAIFRPLQRGLSICVTSNNVKIIKMMHALLTKLMSIFPPDHKHSTEDHLDQLYATISKTICDGLSQFEKNPKANTASLYGTLMILKAACTNNQSYIDRLIVPFMHILDRLKKEHIAPQQPQPPQPSQAVQPSQPTPTTTPQQSAASLSNTEITLDLLILSLDLVKNRVIVMGVDLRKMFIGTILVGLIEKSADAKVIRAIIKMIEEWMKNKNTPVTVLQAPTLREKSILLVKLMHYVEKRFSDDAELNGQFLELVNFIYRDDQLKVSELTAKLEQAFLAGLRCSQPHIRSKFFEVFDGSMRRKLHDRLLYIVCSHSWDSIQHHYWIKQCIELLLLTTNTTHSQIKNSNENHLLPSITSVINMADSEEKNNFVIYTSLQPDQHDNVSVSEDKEDAIDMEMNVDNNLSKREESERPMENRIAVLCKLLNRQSEFLDASRKVKTEQFLIASSQLCHMDTHLAESIWLNVFPKLWSILEEGQQHALDREFVAFLSSGTHVIQKDCNPSAINTFVEALSQCQPPIYVPPSLMTYLGKSHNLWHRMTLMLENMALEWPNRKEALASTDYRSEYDFDVELQNEIANSNNSDTVSAVLEPLSQMYSALYEEDLWAGLWQKNAKYAETNAAIFYEQMGHFEEAQKLYETAMTKFKQDMQSGNISADINSELLLWENHWIRCTKELNEWNILLEYGQTNKDKHAFLIMDSAWRVPDWNLMKQALIKVEQTSPKQMGHKVSLYRGYLAILNQEDSQHIPSVEKYVEISSALCMREWRRLPKVVSHIHLPILQSAQLIMELQEASQIHQQPLKIPDIKAVVKTWRNRLPIISDNLSHWSDIFTWRQHHYQIITDSMANCDLGPHASAQTIIQFGKIARKQNLPTVCHHLLSRIHTIPTVPVIDCFQKIRQEVKCFVQMAANSQDQSSLSEALEVIETTNIKYFKPELVAEIYALKGNLLKQMSRMEEANKAFSAAVQLSDVLPSAWGMWGNYLEANFARDPKNTNLCLSAMVCFLHACRQQNESKTRKYFSKIIWLLTYEEKRSEMLDMLDKFGQTIPPIQWLPWIPQLLNCLIQYEGEIIMNLLSNIARSFPQAVYFPIRTLYLMLKIEQRERYKSVEQALAKNQQHQGGEVSQEQGTSSTTSTQANQISSQSIQIKASPPMYRCSKIMHMQRDIHPTTLSSLEGIVDQMVWFRENWYEEVLRQLKQGLAKCYGIAFDNRASVNEATITPHTLNFVRKLVSTFGIGIENISNNTNIMAGSSASESLARRAQATVQDPVFQKLKGQFTSDFDFSQPDATKMQNLITKLKIWIKILDVKTKQLPKSFLIEEKCRFLSNFNQKTAEVDLPGELLLPRHSHYHVKIAKFMPRVEIVQKHNTSARRLFIQGTNGKIYPYLVVNDSGLADARREERVLQLLRMLNSYLIKYKETSKRFLHITVPRVVAVSPQMRLVEDHPSSISLLDVLKSYCSRLNIEYDAPITRYYERLAEVQLRGSQTTHVTLRDIFKEIQINMVPKTVLKDWSAKTFASATDYWTFRKMFTLQLSLWSIVEYAFHLTRLNPDMLYLHQDSGLINVSYFKFDLDDITGEMNSNRPVPFRLTPNIAEFITNMGIHGPLSASIMATARCFSNPSYQISSILKTILADEIITIHRKHIINTKPIDPNEDLSQDKTFSEIKIDNVIQTVNKGVNQISERLNLLSNYDFNDGNKMAHLITLARNPDQLCRMDPIWFPWF